ncbi:MAG: hypothetical protein E7159_00480 [Firmicutes bacterium]|nr:hypothetical protein [Bacillota bacterium]
MGLFDFESKTEYEYYEELTDEEKEELEEKMDDLNLEDWQKELVREGKYDIEDFEEEVEDEDDYYYDDEDDDESDDEDEEEDEDYV